MINTLLCNGRYVDPALLSLIRVVVEDRIPLFSQNNKYTSKMICDEGFWDCLEKGDQIQAGWCMKHLVTTGELPLRVAESRHEYPVYYQLK